MSHLEVLKRCEWAGHAVALTGESDAPATYVPICPVCCGLRQATAFDVGVRTVGHTSDCGLDYAIRHVEAQQIGVPCRAVDQARGAQVDDRGLFDKIAVIRNDQAKFHKTCRYFVLDLTHDPVARLAAMEYAVLVAPQAALLAEELSALVASIDEDVRGKPCPGPCGGKYMVHAGDRGGLCLNCGPK